MTILAFNNQGFINLDSACRKEWLETNALGGYASSSLPCCNTRCYHGLLVANLAHPAGRHVLLSTIEETIVTAQQKKPLSTRKHPGVYYPEGWKALRNATVSLCPAFEFQVNDYKLTREIMMLHKENTTLLRYTLAPKDQTETILPPSDPVKLEIRPLLAFRSFHALTKANMNLQTKAYPVENGFTIQPYNELPPLYAVTNQNNYFYPAPDWYYNVEYQEEKRRGYPFTEDLFLPGILEIELQLGQSALVAFATSMPSAPLKTLWDNEWQRREQNSQDKKAKTPKSVSHTSPPPQDIIQVLSNAGEHFLITTPQGKPAVIAGYHWFDSWGRDTMIALPGLTFYAGRTKEGLDILQTMGASAKNGFIPNVFNPDGVNHAYNSVDASLWYAWAVQQLSNLSKKHLLFIKKHCWTTIKNIISSFMESKTETLFLDSTGLLHTGNEHTQLTWMDATVNGRPVTPRHGCPVEINALWYNTLCFAEELAKAFEEKTPVPRGLLKKMRDSFKRHFYLSKGYLADTWRKDFTDHSLRPNQLFAVSLPYSMLDKTMQKSVVNIVHNHLLTSFGMRTLSLENPAFHAHYFGTPEQRDSAYHQGTVWPWLLGAYTEATLKVSSSLEKTGAAILHQLTPLFTEHMKKQAGIGSISEVFDATAPFLPGGCIAQAWSVAEALRSLVLIQESAPLAFTKWQTQLTGA